MSALDRLGEVSREYQRMADAYRQVAMDAAAAEAEHKARKAQVILSAKADGERVSHAEAESRAEADENVAALYRDRLVKAAMADAHREKLRQLREQVANGRTYVASEREVDRMHAEGNGGES